MSGGIALQCRCGWNGRFERNQAGMLLSCPTCDRDLLVTEDETEFLNRNLGPQDFAFDDADESTAPPARKAAKGAGGPGRSRAGSPAGSRTRKALEKSTGRGDPRLLPSRRKARQATRLARHRSRFWIPVFIGAVAVSLAGYGWIAHSNREDSIERAREISAAIVDRLTRERFTAAADDFASKATARELKERLQGITSPSEPLAAERIGERYPGGRFSTPSAFSAIYELRAAEDRFTLRLHLSPRGREWEVVRFELKRMTPAERVGRGK